MPWICGFDQWRKGLGIGGLNFFIDNVKLFLELRGLKVWPPLDGDLAHEVVCLLIQLDCHDLLQHQQRVEVLRHGFAVAADGGKVGEAEVL